MFIVSYPLIESAGDKGNDTRHNHILSQEPDYWPTEGWLTSTPEEQEMDSSKLEDMVDFIEQSELNIDSIIVIRNGYIVLEEYPDPYFTQSTLHTIQSATKSFTSTCVGIAIQRGVLSGVDRTMANLFSDYSIANLDSWKLAITVEHLLTMSTGLEWHEHDIPYDQPGNDLMAMYDSDDMYQYVLNCPTEYEPGTRWAYHSGCSELLGGVVEKSSGYGFIDFVESFLFDPLGIDYYDWWNPHNNPQYGVSGGLYLTPRDMAKLGFLFLNNGTWDDKEIVSEEWVSIATSEHYRGFTGADLGYGYQWWTLDGTDIYAAWGARDQRIFVSPENDLVVVFTADIDDEDWYPAPSLLRYYILGAIEDYTENQTMTTSVSTLSTTETSTSTLSITVTSASTLSTTETSATTSTSTTPTTSTISGSISTTVNSEDPSPNNISNYPLQNTIVIIIAGALVIFVTFFVSKAVFRKVE